MRPRATFYPLLRPPAGVTSEAYADELLNNAGVLTISGTGFGPGGEGCVRLTVCVAEDLLSEAVARIAAHVQRTDETAGGRPSHHARGCLTGRSGGLAEP